MNRLKGLHGRAVILAVTLAAISAPTRVVHPAAPPRAVEISERDVAASNAKIRMAYADLAAMWRARFAELGARFVVPRVVRYRGAARSSCGIMQPNNAAYCPSENTIYYDELFVAAQAKAAALELGTDGDMAGKLAGLGLTKDQVEGVLSLSREVIERVVWEVVPDLAEAIIREEIRRITAD